MENGMLQLVDAETRERVLAVVADPEHESHLTLCGFLQVGPTLVVQLEEEDFCVYELPEEWQWDWDEVACGRQAAGQLSERLPIEVYMSLVGSAIAMAIFESILGME